MKTDWLSVNNTQNGNGFEDVPLLAIKNTTEGQKIEAVGKDANRAKIENPSLELINGFEHPRVIIGDFAMAEKTLQYFIQMVDAKAIFRVRPIVIMHPLGRFSGGLSSIEVNALKELAIGAGARKAYVWYGRQLTRDEITTGSFPEMGWLQGIPDWIKIKGHL